ncbi:MAG TPA: hypothetical protein VKA46_27740 [Gemmataceae bacterium]|nr:hypothetical protein [Gemmataceae bacterium]
MISRRWRLVLWGLLAAGLGAGVLAVVVVGLSLTAESRRTAESPEARRLRSRLEAADAGWHNVEVRTRSEDGVKVTFAAGDYRLGGKRYSFMLLTREGKGGLTVEVEDAEESRLVAHWAPPNQPSQPVPDANFSAHWDEAKRLMRQLLEAFQ